ncbi:MAG: type II toxin-antitoxin system HicB family antitoxin [Hyphomicrobium sp.]
MAQVLYPAVIEQGAENFGVYFPDLPGCVSAGETIAETVQNAHEVLALHILGMTEDGEPLPVPTAVEAVVPNPECICVAAIILVGANLPAAPRNIEVAIDGTLIEAIDAMGADRSRFLSDAARVELARRAAG